MITRSPPSVGPGQKNAGLWRQEGSAGQSNAGLWRQEGSAGSAEQVVEFEGGRGREGQGEGQVENPGLWQEHPPRRAVLAPVEIDDKKLSSTPWEGLHTWDVLLPSKRRLIWAYLALVQPSWVHLGPPCTFWSPLARRCNMRLDADNERLRLKALAFLVFSLQVCNFQRQHQRYWSLEQPPHCVSWNLDIVKEFTERELAAGNAALKFDSCAWGHKDPGNGKPFLKRQCFASNAQLVGLHRRCSCSPRVHQVVEGTVESGSRKGERRSAISGEYPVEFCNAFAGVVGEHCWVARCSG